MSQPTKGAPKPPIRLEPTYGYTEIAEAFGVSVVYLKREVAARRLPHGRAGRYIVCTQADLDQWQQNLREYELDRKAARLTRQDQRAKPAKPIRAKPSSPEVQADDDIKRQLGLVTT